MADPTVIRHADRRSARCTGHARLTPDRAQASRSVTHGNVAYATTHWILCGVYSPAVISTGDLRGRQVQHEQLIQIAVRRDGLALRPDPGSGYALLLTDASGVILCEKIDATLKSLFRSAGLLIGADWSELHEGTNGIGTCISVDRAGDRPSDSEHFGRGTSACHAPARPYTTLRLAPSPCWMPPPSTRANPRQPGAHHGVGQHVSAAHREVCLPATPPGCLYRTVPCSTRACQPVARRLVGLRFRWHCDRRGRVAVRLLAARGRQDLVGRKFEEIFDTRIEDYWRRRRSDARHCGLAGLGLGRRFSPVYSGARANSRRRT